MFTEQVMWYNMTDLEYFEQKLREIDFYYNKYEYSFQISLMGSGIAFNFDLNGNLLRINN